MRGGGEQRQEPEIYWIDVGGWSVDLYRQFLDVSTIAEKEIKTGFTDSWKQDELNFLFY